MNDTLPRSNRIIFKLFLVAIFFLYYQTKVIPGTIHTWLMFAGVILTVPILARKYVRGDIRLPLDYVLTLVLLIVIVLGFLVNLGTSMWLYFQAYVLMLVTYVYVKENATPDTLEFMAVVVRWFLLINGLLLFAQVITGGFYPARLLASGNPPLLIASGVSDGPTKNGMLISFGLSFMFAKLLLQRLRFTALDGLAVLIGAVSLFASTSRAGIASFVAMVGLGIVFVLVQALRKRQFKPSVGNILVVVALLYGVSALVGRYGLGFDWLFDLRGDAPVERYGLEVLLYKATTFNDGSLAERFDTIVFFTEQLRERPLYFLSVGFGPGTFDTMYGHNIHNSYLELLFVSGVFGFLTLIWLLGLVTFRALRRRDSVRITPMIFGLGSVMVFMSTHDVMRGRLLWIPLGVIAAFAYRDPREPREPRESRDSRESRESRDSLPAARRLLNERPARYHRVG